MVALGQQLSPQMRRGTVIGVQTRAACRRTPGDEGRAGLPPLSMFRALLLSVWYDLSDVKLTQALARLDAGTSRSIKSRDKDAGE